MFVGKAVLTTQSTAATSLATYYCALEAFLRNAGMMTQRARSADPAFLPGRAKRDQAASLNDGSWSLSGCDKQARTKPARKAHARRSRLADSSPRPGCATRNAPCCSVC